MAEETNTTTEETDAVLDAAVADEQPKSKEEMRHVAHEFEGRPSDWCTICGRSEQWRAHQASTTLEPRELVEGEMLKEGELPEGAKAVKVGPAPVPTPDDGVSAAPEQPAEANAAKRTRKPVNEAPAPPDEV